MKTQIKFHANNIHKSGYDLDSLCKVHKSLIPFVFTNTYKTKTIDFANPKAIKALNKALLLNHYGIDFWEFPDTNLCPPIPGRVDYIHYIADLLNASNINKDITVLDIGTGATCIYPLLGHAAYNWNFVGTEIDKSSLKNAQDIINKNELNHSISLREQTDTSQILKGVLTEGDKFSVSICNPPFYKSEAEAIASTTRKLKGLNNLEGEVIRNFSGTHSELWYKGGEKSFIHNYLYESTLFKNQCFWFTTLVSKKDLVKGIYNSLEKLGAITIKTITMSQGNKTSRIIAWSFLTKDEQEQWLK